MQAIKSIINPQDETYQTNYAANSSAVERLRLELARSTKGGGEQYVKRHLARGRLLPRERIEMLLDEGSYFLEIAPLAGIGMDNEFVGAGVVGGVGLVSGRECLIIANEATVKGGAVSEIGQLKNRRLSDVGTENRLPSISLVESAGADLPVQAKIFVPGGRGFQVTGSVGNVMNESARAAMSYVRSRAEKLGLHDEFFNKSDIHLHIPFGAQPKDGPSAGVTIATALVSLASNRKMKPQVGMTGEITLRGQVLPIGGVKEKVLAGHRIGLRTIILPKRNEQDLDDVPEEVKKSMKFVFVEAVDEVLDAALEPVRKSKQEKPTTRKKATPKKVKRHAKTPAR